MNPRQRPRWNLSVTGVCIIFTRANIELYSLICFPAVPQWGIRGLNGGMLNPKRNSEWRMISKAFEDAISFGERLFGDRSPRIPRH
jgi:hypothetical protein